ncbi:hypothetical protein [Winogradskyella jejuensis]|uniref:Lipocalin-like domain-containing protein n=1 Tax=Winogradskyella jejuensis TaxID=1089305 RepID=A0A1M5JNU8_9FLAO|nr:hypothetical protein [Winogradskyella jejuensis]SHG42244.1 hypothetical protein SAMN05444148_0098 [Winogradskyella jejuensis]
MRTSIYTLLLLLLFTSCKNENVENSKSVNESKPSEQSTETPLEGNWEMIGFYNYKDNKVIDSFRTNEGYRQVKMFNKNKVMWSKLVPTDSIEWFGYGSYTATDSTLTEQMQYGSSVMNQIIAEQKEFNYKLVVTKNTFSQIRTDDEGNAVYSENYRRIN